MDYIKMTEEFITAMDQDKGKEIDNRDSLNILRLRMKLISEETNEVEEAVADLEKCIAESGTKEELIRYKAALLKELCDLQYVLSGFAVTFGLPFDEAFRKVHESNMSKLGDDGKPVYREDGKILKGPNYKKPDLSDLV